MVIETKGEARFDHGWDCGAVRRTLLGSRRTVLVAHQNADGDAVGSLTGMYALLRRATQADIAMLLPDGCPADLAWMPHSDLILGGKADADLCRKAIGEADLVVVLDLCTLDRTGCLAEELRRSPAPRMLVDHHLDPAAGEFALMVSEPEVSSTCELVYWLMLTTFGEEVFSAEAATSLYTGICTDTGTFSYSNHRQSVYHAAAGLLRHGIDPAGINRRIRNVFSEARLRFFGHAMDRLLTVYPERQTALVAIPASEMEAYGVESADLTGLVNEVMKLRDVDCGILVREEGDGCRLSLRSKSSHDVNRLARELFGGGGHERAAGATSRLPLAETVAAVRRKLMLALVPLLVVLATACRPVPVVDIQPAQGDSLRENLINANRYIAGSEGVQIDAYLSRRGWDAVQTGEGVRVHETSRGNGRPIGYGDTVEVSYTVETIGGDAIYRDRTDTLVAGRLKPTRGLDAALRTLCHHGEATVIAPSGQAYGVVGDGDRIGTRMILVYKLKINN